METTKLQDLRTSIEELSIEAKDAFIKKFPYLKITDTECRDILANKIQFNVPETDGSMLIGLNCKLTRPFSIIEQLMLNGNIPLSNFRIDYVFDKKVTFFLNRFFYHTKKKFIFNM